MYDSYGVEYLLVDLFCYKHLNPTDSGNVFYDAKIIGIYLFCNY